MSGAPRERGVALITALLVVALATIAAVAMAARQQVDIRRSGNVYLHDQAYHYSLAGEQWAGQILARDRRNNETDHLGEDWARQLPPMPLDEGTLSGRLQDLQGRFNLNNLVRQGEVSDVDRERFERLLAALELEPSLAQAVIDWIDADINPTLPDGAEDTHYLGLERPYRPPNAGMASPSELRLVKGFDAQTVRALMPYVTALPGRTAINVNTAAAPVLAALAPGVDVTAAQALVEARPEAGYAEVEDLFQESVFAGRETSTQGLAVASSHFLLRIEVRMGSARLTLYSVLQRPEQGVVALMRGQGAY